MDQNLPHALPRDLYYTIVHALRAALPPLPTDMPDVAPDGIPNRTTNGTPEDQTRRDHAVIAQVASLLPADGEEALLAAQYVAANAQALDCLRLVHDHPRDIPLGLKCMAQAASMMRQARSARSLLMKIQVQRSKREANHAATDSAAWLEHCAIGLMTDALNPPVPVTDALNASAHMTDVPDASVQLPCPPAPATPTYAGATGHEPPAPRTNLAGTVVGAGHQPRAARTTSPGAAIPAGREPAMPGTDTARIVVPECRDIPASPGPPPAKPQGRNTRLNHDISDCPPPDRPGLCAPQPVSISRAREGPPAKAAA